jgi:PKD repeat protein
LQPPSTNGIFPFVVNFDGSGSVDPDGSITEMRWEWKDGTGNETTFWPNNTRNHTFVSEGTYNVELWVKDNDGVWSALPDTSTIQSNPNIPPQAVAKAILPLPVIEMGETKEIEPGTQVTFDGSESKDPDGSIVSYDWDFGDGNTGSGVNVVHQYNESGTFLVSLTVTDDKGSQGTTGLPITVIADAKPMVTITGTPQQGNIPLTVDFPATIEDPDEGTITGYEWDFGEETGITPGGPSIQHTYTTEKTFNAILTVEYQRPSGGTENITSNTVQIKTKQEPALLGIQAANVLIGNQTMVWGKCKKLSDTITLTILDTTGKTLWSQTNASCAQLAAGIPPNYTFTEPGVYTAKAILENPACKLCETQAKFSAAKKIEEIQANEIPFGGVLGILAITLLVLLWKK